MFFKSLYLIALLAISGVSCAYSGARVKSYDLQHDTIAIMRVNCSVGEVWLAAKNHCLNRVELLKMDIAIVGAWKIGEEAITTEVYTFRCIAK